MSLPSNQLDAFLSVAQTLSFTKSAELLHVTQSALSQRVMNLERELETTLFIRDRTGVRLTEAAQELVRYCRCKNSLEDDFLSRLKGEEIAGVVRIGGFSSVLGSVVIPSLARLFHQHPNLRLQLVEDELENLPGCLRRGEIDYMILDRRERREDLERIELGTERNVLVQKKKYGGPDVYLDHDEADRTTLDYLKLSGRRAKSIERRYLDNVHGIIAGVRNGLGRAVLPRHLIAGLSDLEVLEPETVLEAPVVLYFYTQPYYSRLHEKVVSALEQKAGSLLGD